MDGLSSICAGLGIVDEDDNGKPIGYAKGEHCSDNLKDLLRYLRRDDPEKREVFKQVCKWNTVKKDLIPIIEFCQEDRNLVLNSVKVLVFLTMPIEPTSFDIPQQIEFLWGLKSAITYSDIIPVIVSLLESPLENLESESFTEDDWKLVQLVLTLFRNILAIQDISTQLIAGGSATQFLSIRDRFLELLFEENVMDLILVLSQHTGGSHGYLRHDNLLLLEIFHNIFKGQEPELIAKANLKNLEVEAVAGNSVSSLESIMKEEQEKKKLTRFHNLSCYSQFSGTFTRVSVDGSKALLKGNPSASSDALLKAHKNIRGPSKRAVGDHGKLPSTKHEILQLLDDFVSQFLKAGYNVLMQSIREDIEKELQEIQSSDVVIFFEVAQFVTAFQYHKCTTKKPSVDVENEASSTFHDENSLFKGSMCGPIAETMNESMFLMVISKWRYAFEGLKQSNDYKFLSAAGSLVKIMIRMLDLVLKQAPEDSKEPQTARILLLKLFYDQTEEGMTQFLLNLIKSFDTHKQSKSDLANLVESMHVVLRLLENLQARGTLRVAKKSRKKRTKKTIMTKNEHVHEPSVDNSAPQNEVENPTCEESVDSIMLEKETLANQDPDIVEDVSIRDPIPVGEPIKKPVDLGSNESEMDGRNIIDNDGLNLEADSSSGDEQPVLADEVDLNVSSLVSALANNSIIQNLCWLLKSYKSNSITTNHYILSMLRRICEDLELSPMLYQLSLLTIFNDILEEQKSRPRKEYENIVSFLTSLVRRMLRKMKRHPLLFVEVLFWKTRKECHYINCESLLTELNSMKNQTGEERSGSEKGGNGLFEGQPWVRRSIADALGDDDFVASRLDSQGEDDHFEGGFSQRSGEGNETSTSIWNKPIDGSEISDREGNSAEESDGSLERGNVPALSFEMQGTVKDLFQKYKDNPDCCQLIAGELDPNGNISKLQVSKTLKQLGIKVPAEAKMQSSSASNRLRKNKRDLSRGTTHHHSTTADKSSLKEATHSKKSVHAFSLDQEQEIKDLFEQFKDHRRCSYMIANALDSTGTVSAAKVSRKLKQLGLVRPTKKRSHASMQLRDEVVSDIHSEGADKSDDETLSSLRNRKIKRMPQKSIDEELMAVSSEENLVETSLTGRSTKISERHSRKRVHAFSVDEEQKIKDLFEQFKDHSRCSYMIANALDSTCTVSAAQVSHKLKQLGLDRPKKKRSHASMQLRDEVSSDIRSEGAQESDDDEPLSSLRNRKTKRKSQKSVAKELMTDSFEENLVESNLIGRDSQVSERYEIEQSTELGVDNSSDKEIETIGMDYPNELDAKSNENSLDDDDHDMLADELADFDENEDPVIAVTTQDNSASRRRLRMVLDFDDDDMIDSLPTN